MDGLFYTLGSIIHIHTKEGSDQKDTFHMNERISFETAGSLYAF